MFSNSENVGRENVKATLWRNLRRILPDQQIQGLDTGLNGNMNLMKNNMRTMQSEQNKYERNFRTLETLGTRV